MHLHACMQLHAYTEVHRLYEKVISGKLDGISVLYSGGKLYTRGRSTHGMDISYMVPYLDLPKRKDVTLRGELLISPLPE